MTDTGDRFLSEVQQERGKGVVHAEDVYDTSPEDLWSAITEPERVARWIGEVSGDLRQGGRIHLKLTSTWEDDCEVLTCDAPRLLRIVTVGDDDAIVEARLTPEGDRTRLVIEEHGLPLDASAYAAGWQVHLEDLGATLAGRERSDWHARWVELSGPYGARTAG